jgi:hypothetical protein
MPVASYVALEPPVCTPIIVVTIHGKTVKRVNGFNDEKVVLQDESSRENI